MRFMKSKLLEGDELLAFRKLDGPEYSIVWYATARFDEEGNSASLVDQLEIGGDEPDEHFLVTVVWVDCERREAVIESLARSFAFDRGSDELGANLLEEGRRRRDPLPLLSALEVSGDRLPAAEELERIYARRGLAFEKRQFANWVRYQVESGDLRFMDLNERVWDWRMDERPDQE